MTVKNAITQIQEQAFESALISVTHIIANVRTYNAAVKLAGLPLELVSVNAAVAMHGEVVKQWQAAIGRGGE